MTRSLPALALAALCAAAPHLASAAETAATPAPTRAERTFVARVQRDLPRRYPTPARAEAAGYVRYTNEDRTGAISYALTDPAQWDVKDVDRPAQLWYDVRGRLIGADYSAPYREGSPPPSLFGIAPAHLGRFPAHVHYVTCTGATCVYGHAIGVAKYAAAGGDPAHPTAEGLVRAGAVKDAANVRTVFLFPAVWDASVWVVPNPNGPFAEMNPNVTPSANASKGED